MTRDGREIDADKPLFIPKANPRDYEQWALEYDEMENRHMKPANGNGFKVDNLRSLRTNMKQQPVRGQAKTHQKPPPVSTASPRDEKIEKRKPRGHASPLQAFTQKRPRSALAPAVRGDAWREVKSPVSITPTVRRMKKIDRQVLETIIQLVNKEGPIGTRFDIDTRAMDLKWLKAAEIVVPHLNTLATLSTELLGEDGVLRETHPLNSPRSIYIMFNNGVSVADLQQAPVASFNCEKTHGLRLKKHHDASRAELHSSLVNQYLDLCSDVGLQDITAFLSNTPQGGGSTANEKRKLEQQRALEATRTRLERQYEDAKRRSEEEIRAEQERERRRRVVEEEKKQQQVALSERMRELGKKKEERLQQIQAIHEREQTLVAKKLAALTTRDEQRKQREEERALALKQEREQKRKQKQEQIASNLHRNEEILEAARRAAMEKYAVAEQRKAEKDAQERMAKMRGKEQAEAVARRRLDRLDKVKEETLAKRDKELEKIAAADANHKEYQMKKMKELEVKKQKEKALADTRREKKELAEAMMEELRRERLARQDQRTQQFETVKGEQEKGRELKADLALAEVTEKRFSVACKMRKNEFEKALLLQGIRDKEVRVESSSEAKEATLKQCWAERQMLKREKQRIIEAMK